MADEAVVTMVARMRDEGASAGLRSMGNTVASETMRLNDFRMTLVATGSALTAIGSLANRSNNEFLKQASTWLMVAGAMSTTTGAILHMIPMVTRLTASLRQMAVVQAILKALSGPAGWVTLGVGAAVGVGAVAAINASNRSDRAGGVVNINVQGSVITERELVGKVKQGLVLNGQRNNGTGIR